MSRESPVVWFGIKPSTSLDKEQGQCFHNSPVASLRKCRLGSFWASQNLNSQQTILCGWPRTSPFTCDFEKQLWKWDCGGEMLQGCPTPADVRVDGLFSKVPQMPGTGHISWPLPTQTSWPCPCVSLLLLSPLASHHHPPGPNSPLDLRWAIHYSLPKPPQAHLQANTSKGSAEQIGRITVSTEVLTL